MQKHIIEAIRTQHETKMGTALTQSEKNQLTRGFNALAERAGGVGTILARYNHLEVYRDADNKLVIADSEVIRPTNGEYLYEFQVGSLVSGKAISKADMTAALTAVAPTWAVVDGTRKARLYVRGYRSANTHSRVDEVRAAVLDAMGFLSPIDTSAVSPKYAAIDVWNYLTKVEAFNRNRRAMYRNTYKAMPKQTMSRPVVTHKSKPMDGFLSSLSERQTAATPEALFALPLPTSITRSTRTWGIELEHVDMKGIEKPHSSWGAKGDGSLRGAKGVNGDTCAACRPDRRRSNTSPSELIFEDGQAYPDGCPCEACLTEFVNAFSNLAAITPDENGVLRFRAVATESPITDAPALPATWECFCEGQTREFVSPILTTVNDENLRTLADKLDERKRNQSAGVHVHVGAEGLDLRGQAELIRNWATIEHIITPLYQREEREYCKPLRLSDAVKAHNVSNPKKGIKDGSYRDHLSRERYNSVNLTALDAHGTIEFRAMGPVYTYDYLVRWATFCRDMVNVAAAGTPAKVWHAARTFEDVLAILTKYGQEVGK